jgi:hypothetical protein
MLINLADNYEYLLLIINIYRLDSDFIDSNRKYSSL